MMDGGRDAALAAFGLTADALGHLMPLYLALAPDGMITAAGVTLAKIFPGTPLTGQSLFDVFSLRRIGAIGTMAALRDHAGEKLTLSRRDGGAGLCGIVVPLSGSDGLLLNLSFGIGVIDAVRDFGLTNADFAPTDHAFELLFMVEANAAVMGELARLNMGLKGAKSEAEARALTDTLTGLGNRRALDEALARIIDRGRPFALLHLDLDYFKAVNDTRGHAAGDHVLTAVAEVLRRAMRDGDIVTRVGGDEFVLVLPNPPDNPTLLRIADRIITGLTMPIPFEGQPCQISGSIGIALSSHYRAGDLAPLQAAADAALYASKHAGRGRATLANPP